MKFTTIIVATIATSSVQAVRLPGSEEMEVTELAQPACGTCSCDGKDSTNISDGSYGYGDLLSGINGLYGRVGGGYDFGCGTGTGCGCAKAPAPAPKKSCGCGRAKAPAPKKSCGCNFCAGP